MSLAAAQAMDDLAEELDCAAEGMGAGQGYQVMRALAIAHRAAAGRIRARAKGTAVEVPDEFKAGQAGSKNRQR